MCRVRNKRWPIVDAGSLIVAQRVRSHRANTRTHEDRAQIVLHTNKCANLTAVSVLVDDSKRININ